MTQRLHAHPRCLASIDVRSADDMDDRQVMHRPLSTRGKMQFAACRLVSLSNTQLLLGTPGELPCVLVAYLTLTHNKRARRMWNRMSMRMKAG